MSDAELTPLRKQYLEIKRQYQNVILLFRLGDFYETFDADAELAARELDLVLTSRTGMNKTGQRVPMAGIPFHAAENYIGRLIAKGYHVAICEQTGTDGKGLFKREVIRVVTPGTVVEPGMLAAERNNYLAALLVADSRAGLAHVDITTGEFLVTTLQSIDIWSAVRHELLRLHPAELLLPDNAPPAALDGVLTPRTPLPAWKFDPGQGRNLLLEHFHIGSLAGLGIEQWPLAIGACGAILRYVQDTQPSALNLLNHLSVYTLDDFMTLDPATRRNLELTETLRSGQVKGSLLGVLDQTITSMGARLLRQWVHQPLLDLNRINARLDHVAAFHADGVRRAEVLAALKPLADLERITNRILGCTANPRDLVALQDTLAALPTIKELMGTTGTEGTQASSESSLSSLSSQLDPCSDVLELITGAIADDTPAVLSKPGIIRPGYSAELDGINEASRHARDWIAGLEKAEKDRTGIKHLKVGYNKVFGYYIEISRGQSEMAPANYLRKQTLTNVERFITPELKEYETLVLNAEERVLEMETRLFKDLCQQIGAQAGRLLNTARVLAQIDAFAALAEAAARYDYVRPELVAENVLEIHNGRHPVVEQFLQAGQRFVPNDVIFEPGECVRVITGPNMSGKCVRGDTLVFTDAGVVPIASLQPGEAAVDTFTPLACCVKGLDGKESATHFYSGGRRKTIRVRTRLGYEIEGTPEHRIWARFPDGQEGWKPLAAIEPGDFLVIDRQIDLWGRQETIETPRASNLRPRTNLKFYKLPVGLTPDLAYIMGLLVGDGTLTYQHYLSLSTGDAFIAQEFNRILRDLFGIAPKPASGTKTEFRVSSCQIRLFFEELGLDYVTATQKRVPDVILRAPKPIVRGFLQGLFDTDGYADLKGNVSLSTSSPVLAHQVQMLLLNFGLVASRQTKKGVRSINPSYQVYLYGVEAAQFYRDIGFRLPRKQARAERVSALRMPNVGGIPYLASALKQVQTRIVATANKPVALKRDKSINSIFYTYLPSDRNISYFKLDELLAYCRHNGVIYPELQTLAARRFFYDPAVGITPGEAEVFDLSVEPSHSFVANGFVNHNSTYLRQSSLVVLLAQMGSFVPADSARLGVFDRIFTRIGAQDEIHAGQSTFMVEMVETANILHHATARSLLVLDEIGRGTSTYDGLSLAWAIVEHIHNHPRLKSKTLFATHYHELTDPAAVLPGVRNYNVAVTEEGDNVVFLHRIIPGGADRSYGIHVAQLAGLPRPVIARAQAIMAQLEASGGRAVRLDEAAPQQIALFPETNPLLDEIKRLDLNTLTPMEALSRLFEWQARFGKSSSSQK
jgi:DNA mismatch repair protein MutS